MGGSFPDTGGQKKVYSMISNILLGCSTARNKGTCDNRLVIRQDELEGLVLLHPNMAGYYRQQVSQPAEALNDDENRAEAADRHCQRKFA